MPNPGFFITATDTGVGKTTVSAGLGMALREKKIDVGVMKPVQTGGVIENQTLVSEDTKCLINAVGCNDDIELINPYCLSEPLAPSVAASREGTSINTNKIKKCFNILRSRHNVMIVEGIGGILVPIRDDYLVSDMILDFELPVIIVARPTLGTINHTLLTVKFLQNIGANIFGIIINYAEKAKGNTAEKAKGNTAEETNPSVIKKLSGVHLLGILPYCHEIDIKNNKTNYLKQAIIKNIDLAAIIESL